MPQIETAVAYRITFTREEMRTVMAALVAHATQASTDLHVALRSHTQLAVTDWAASHGVRLVRSSQTKGRKSSKSASGAKSATTKGETR